MSNGVILKDKFKTKLTDIKFGKRIQTYFKNLNLITVEDVVNFPIENLIKVKGFGMKSYYATMGQLADEDIYHAKLWSETQELINEDKVNHPKHYTNGDIEPIDYINGNNMDYLEGNIIKYISRYKYKNGVEDLKKARFYLNMLIEREE